MNAFVYHFVFEFRSSIRNRAKLVGNYLLPLGLYALMGPIMGPIVPGFRETMIPAMVGVAIMAATTLTLPQPLVMAREVGIFRSYKINGVPAFSILVISAITTVIHTLVVAVIICTTAPLFFKAVLPTNWPGFIITVLIMVFACAGLGVLISVVSPSSQVALLMSNIIFIPSIVLSGMTGLPTSLLPTAIRKASQLFPATHGMNAFRAISQGLPADFNPVGSLVLLMINGAMSFILAIYLFNWDRHNATRRAHPLFGLFALLPYVVGMFLLS
ncbi:MAG: ABC transporter permease [Phycisphaerales bacterium]|nr:MAG: ABC transporter permease [Phycisphaerales bacterium]